MLAEYMKAGRKVARGQSYTVDGRSLTRGDMAEINRQISRWSGIVERLSAGRGTGPSVQRFIPHG